MKAKYVIIVSLMLAILTIGAASASDDFVSDDGNLTAGPEDTVLESSVDEIELNANDAEDVVGDDEKITDYDYFVDMDDEFLKGGSVSCYGYLPEDASGTVAVSVDGGCSTDCDLDNYGEGHTEFTFGLSTEDLDFGLHNCKFSYAGDDKYAGFEYEKTFRVSNVAVNIPDEITKEINEELWIRLYEGMTGQIAINIDGSEYKNGSLEDLRSHYDYELYFIPLILDYLPFGNHSYEIITTTDGEGTVSRTGSFNMSYLLDVEDNDFNNVGYGTDINITVYAPDDARSNVSVVLNGKSFSYKLNGAETTIPLTGLLFGTNNLTLTYSDDKYPLKTVKCVLNVKGVIDIPDGYSFDYNTDEVISLTLPDDAKGMILVYKLIYDEDTGDSNQVFVGSALIENGYAEYPIKNLGLGSYEVLVTYENGSYSVNDCRESISIYPAITCENAVGIGESANFTVQFPQDSNGNLLVTINEYDEEGDPIDWDAEPIELYNGQIGSNVVTIPLNTSKAGLFRIFFSYEEGDKKVSNQYDEFRFNVHAADRYWQLDADFPELVLQGEYTFVTVSWPLGANGRADLFVDGNRESSISGSFSYDADFSFTANFELGVHTWEIRYYGDSYYVDSSQNGTFEVTWIDVPEVLEIGGNVNIEVNVKGGVGEVKLKVDGVDYDEQTLVDNHATFDMSRVSQGNHTYEITLGNLTKTGSFNMSYIIDSWAVGDDNNDMEFSKSNELAISLPEDAVGSVDVIFDGNTYSGVLDSDGVAHVTVPFNWGENIVTIRFGGDEKYEAKEVQKTFTVGHGIIVVSLEDGLFANASIILPSDANGSLTISYNDNILKEVQLENGRATVDGEGLPIGCYVIEIEYSGNDYDVEDEWVHVSIPAEVNITGEIKEGDDCIIDIELPGSSSILDVYVDYQWNTSANFEDGKVHIAILGLSLGNHTVTFNYGGYDYNDPFSYYDVDYGYSPIEYKVEVKSADLIDPDFAIIIADVEYGNPIEVNVTANDVFEGDVVVKIGENDVPVHVAAGKGSAVADLALPAGNYTATIDFDKTDKFNAAHAETTFNVTAKHDAQDGKLAIEVSDIDLGGSVTIYITINENATKNVTVKVSEYYITEPIIPTPAPDHELYEKTFEVEISAGKGNVTISDLTNSAKYNVVATYEGDDMVVADENTTSFRVLEDADLDVEIPQFISENETLFGIVSMKNAKGGDTIYINLELTPRPDGIFLGLVMIQKKGNSTNFTVSGFSEGTYTLKATFEGNDYYKPASVVKTLEVRETLLDPELEILPIEDIIVGGDATVSFTINRNATGDVVISVDGENRTVTLSKAHEGAYVMTFSGLGVGTHNVTVSYAGGKNERGEVDPGTGMIIPDYSIGAKAYDFGPAVKNATFKVKPIPVSPGLEATADVVCIGQTTTVTVTINNRTTGKVSINVSGEDKEIEIVNGTGTIGIPALSVGEHIYEVSFEGDDCFLAESKNVTVNVKDYDVRIEVVNGENQYVSGNFTFRVVNNTDGSAVENVTVMLRIGNNVKTAFSATTDGNGIASFKTSNLYEFIMGETLPIKPLEVGNHTVEMSIKNANLTAGKLITNLTITPANVKITIDAYEEYFGSDKYLTFTVTKVDGEPLSGSVFKVEIPGFNTAYVSTDENGTSKVSVKQVGKGTHEISITNNDTKNIANVTQKGNFTVKPLSANFSASARDVLVGENATIDVKMVQDFQGVVKISIDGQEQVMQVQNGTLTINLGNMLKAGEHTYELSYLADLRYDEGNQTVSFKVNCKNIGLGIEIANVDNVTPITVKVTADKAFTGNVTVNVAGHNVSVALSAGEGSKTTDIVLATGNDYTASIDFAGNDEFNATRVQTAFNVTAKQDSGSGNGSDDKNSSGNGTGPSGNGTNTTVPVKIDAKDLSAYYNKVTYSVTVYGTDGKAAANVEVVFKVNGKKVGSAVTNANGVGTIKLKQTPKTYKITAEALGESVTKKLTVKQVLALKKVKVKKSARKLVLSATLKEGKKAIKGKRITFKFNGKKLSAKTNKKGVAKVTVKRSVLKKLKVGKKVKYQATYLKDTVKKTVRVKR